MTPSADLPAADQIEALLDSLQQCITGVQNAERRLQAREEAVVSVETRLRNELSRLSGAGAQLQKAEASRRAALQRTLEQLRTERAAWKRALDEERSRRQSAWETKEARRQAAEEKQRAEAARQEREVAELRREMGALREESERLRQRLQELEEKKGIFAKLF